MSALKTYILALALAIATLSACEKEPDPQSSTVTDVEGHTYGTVKVGDQIWMAQNLCCTTYDTESERAGEVIPKSSGVTFSLKPFYVDSTIKDKWTDKGFFAENMTDELLSKVGLLYSWSAAMGYNASEAGKASGEYQGVRQGICPNGWHLPSGEELVVLKQYLNRQFGGFEARYLKSASGWHSDGSGTDDFNFCLLPAGGSDGNQVVQVGGYVHVWSSTAVGNSEAFDILVEASNDGLSFFNSLRTNARSVRCIKNAE